MWSCCNITLLCISYPSWGAVLVDQYCNPLADISVASISDQLEEITDKVKKMLRIKNPSHPSLRGVPGRFIFLLPACIRAGFLVLDLHYERHYECLHVKTTTTTTWNGWLQDRFNYSIQIVEACQRGDWASHNHNTVRVFGGGLSVPRSLLFLIWRFMIGLLIVVGPGASA